MINERSINDQWAINKWSQRSITMNNEHVGTCCWYKNSTAAKLETTVAGWQ